MKSKKVLIGLIVAAFFGGAQIASAQTKANYQNNLIEIGPDNIGGRVRSIVVDAADPNHTTLYAGGVCGGLYKKVGNDYWKYIPYYNSNGQEVTLPISHMIQLPDNSLLIATGEGMIKNHGVTNDRMTPKGRGVYHFNTDDNTYNFLTKTNPGAFTDWTYVNRLAALERNGRLYVYAATSEGLYRWNFLAADPDWTATPEKVVSGEFYDVIIISADNIAYATGPGKVYRVGNVTGESAAVDVTSGLSNFATASRIELEGVTSHELDEQTNTYIHTTYLYAVVVDSTGLLDAVYLTKDQQNWTRLTTSTIVPFNKDNPGYLNAAISVDPRNYKSIYLGGANVFQGEGFVENSYYQWTTMTYTESNLNSGNYMGSVYSNPMFVHSGVHQILPTWEVVDGDTSWVVYFATDGGIYKQGKTGTFTSLNKGFNTVQFTHIAVSPDGSIIGGAVDNGCPFIQSRNAHNAYQDSVYFYGDSTWYDQSSTSIMNHMGNITFVGNGGGVASSMFQQILPNTRRNIFVSAEPGHFVYQGSSVSSVASMGRACTDYADYTNTQTWTIGEAFLSNAVASSDPIPQMKLWETTHNTIWNDSITFTIDTNLTYYHNGVETQLEGGTVIVPGDSILVSSRPNFDYPFFYRFNSSFVVREHLTHKIHNPVVSRMLVNGRDNGDLSCLFINATPNYFRNVWDYNESLNASGDDLEKLMHWAPIYRADYGYSVRDFAFSRDGKSIYINVVEDATDKSFIFRVYDFEKTNVNNSTTFKAQLAFTRDFDGMSRITHFDTIFASDGGFFKRPLTSIAVDPRDGQDNLILTFGGYQTLEPNVVYVKNAGNPATRTVTDLSVTDANSGMGTADPVYSAMIECTHGNIYAGTEKGVFISTSHTNPSWQSFGSFNGVPVTSIIQQTNSLQRQRYQVRDGVNMATYLFAKTKYPYAIYFGTYGRGVFMDTTYVTDHENEISNPEDWVGIQTVDKGQNQVKIYPNPVVDRATVELTVANGGNAVVMIYDINGKLVHSEKLGHLNEGVHLYSLDCTKFNHGMYLVNINLGKESATSKLIVR